MRRCLFFTVIVRHFFIVLLICSVTLAGQRSDSTQVESRIIRSVCFTGKFKLRNYILRREIDSQPGMIYDSLLVERDRKKIQGLGIFSTVKPIVTQAGDSIDIQFELREVWTLLPLLSISRSDGSFDWLIGLREKDLLGLYVNTMVYYRRYEGENSYGVSGGFPRLFGYDLSVGISAAERREVDSFRFGEIISEYRYLNKALFLSVGLRVREKLYFSSFGGYDRENWTLKPEEEPAEGACSFYDYPRYTIGAGTSLGRVYYDHYFYEGTSLSASFSLINEQPEGTFCKWRLGIAGRAYVIKNNFNFAFRLQLLTSSADERVLPYIISGRANVRGYVDKIERGDHFLGGNAEIRLKSFESRIFYTQVAAFTDGGFVWGRNRSFSNALSNVYTSVGIGIRGAIKQFLGNIGRFDLALNTKTGEFTYYLSAYQFF